MQRGNEGKTTEAHGGQTTSGPLPKGTGELLICFNQENNISVLYFKKSLGYRVENESKMSKGWRERDG